MSYQSMFIFITPIYFLIMLLMRIVWWYVFNSIFCVFYTPVVVWRIMNEFCEDLFDKEVTDRVYLCLRGLSGNYGKRSTFASDLRESIKDVLQIFGGPISNTIAVNFVVYYTSPATGFYISSSLSILSLWYSWYGSKCRSRSLFSKYSSKLSCNPYFYFFPISGGGEIGCHPLKKIAFKSKKEVNTNEAPFPNDSRVSVLNLEEFKSLPSRSEDSIYPDSLKKIIRSEFLFTVNEFDSCSHSFEIWIIFYLFGMKVNFFRLDECVIETNDNNLHDYISFFKALINDCFYVSSLKGYYDLSHSLNLKEMCEFLKSNEGPDGSFKKMYVRDLKREVWVGGEKESDHYLLNNIPHFSRLKLHNLLYNKGVFKNDHLLKCFTNRTGEEKWSTSYKVYRSDVCEIMGNFGINVPLRPYKGRTSKVCKLICKMTDEEVDRELGVMGYGHIKDLQFKSEDVIYKEMEDASFKRVAEEESKRIGDGGGKVDEPVEEEDEAICGNSKIYEAIATLNPESRLDFERQKASHEEKLLRALGSGEDENLADFETNILSKGSIKGFSEISLERASEVRESITGSGPFSKFEWFLREKKISVANGQISYPLISIRGSMINLGNKERAEREINALGKGKPSVINKILGEVERCKSDYLLKRVGVRLSSDVGKRVAGDPDKVLKYIEEVSKEGLSDYWDSEMSSINAELGGILFSFIHFASYYSAVESSLTKVGSEYVEEVKEPHKASDMGLIDELKLSNRISYIQRRDADSGPPEHGDMRRYKTKELAVVDRLLKQRGVQLEEGKKKSKARRGAGGKENKDSRGFYLANSEKVKMCRGNVETYNLMLVGDLAIADLYKNRFKFFTKKRFESVMKTGLKAVNCRNSFFKKISKSYLKLIERAKSSVRKVGKKVKKRYLKGQPEDRPKVYVHDSIYNILNKSLRVMKKNQEEFIDGITDSLIDIIKMSRDIEFLRFRDNKKGKVKLNVDALKVLERLI